MIVTEDAYFKELYTSCFKEDVRSYWGSLENVYPASKQYKMKMDLSKIFANDIDSLDILTSFVMLTGNKLG